VTIEQASKILMIVQMESAILMASLMDVEGRKKEEDASKKTLRGFGKHSLSPSHTIGVKGAKAAARATQ